MKLKTLVQRLNELDFLMSQSDITIIIDDLNTNEVKDIVDIRKGDGVIFIEAK